MELNRKNIKILVGLIAFGVLLNVVANNVAGFSAWLGTALGVLTPIIMGFAFAFVLNIPVTFLEEKLFVKRRWKITEMLRRFRRPLSILISYCLVIAVLTGVILVVVPQVNTALSGAISQLQPLVENLRSYLTEYEDEAPELVKWIQSLNIDWEGIRNQITNFMKNGIGSAVSFVMTAATSVFGTATNLILAIILSVNVLSCKERLYRQFKNVIRAYVHRDRAERIIEVGQMSHRLFAAFLGGQVTEALILAVLCYLGMLLFRFPYAFMVSVVVGITALIPILGAWIATFVGALLILTVDPMRALWFLVFFIVLQQLEGNLIYPRVVGTQVGLPAMWVLIAITVGGGILGIMGMLLGVPTCAVVYALTRKSVDERLKGKGILKE